MSLEGDLLLPPRGPAKWGWTQRMMTAIAVARGVLSPDDTIKVSPTTGGLSLSRRTAPGIYGANEYNDLPYGYKGLDVNGAYIEIAPDPFQLRKDSIVNGGTIEFNGTGSVVVPAKQLSATLADVLVCVQVQIELTAAGMALKPVHFTQLVWSTDIILSEAPKIVAVSPTTFAQGGYVLPGSTAAATLFIPVAAVDSIGRRSQWWHGAYWINLGLYHDHFTVTGT